MSIEDKEFDRIREFMLNSYGIDLSKKRILVESRLKQPAASAGYESFPDYVAAVFRDQSLRQEMVTRLTTNYTFFLREDVHYDFMVKTALPALLERSKFSCNARIWSAGCSSGDEAFTAAMYLKGFQERTPRFTGFSITATDISKDALAHARTGVYSAESLDKLPPALRSRFFRQDEAGQYRIDSELMGKVRFSEFNLMDPFPPTLSGFDIIFCRNVMIYFTPETRRQLGKKLLNALKPGGYLFIGLSESLPAAELGFKAVRPSIFMREK